MVFCTLFDSNYIDKGLALWNSLERTAGDYTLYIFCFDDLAYEALGQMNLRHVVLVRHEDIETEELLKLKSGRSKAEYCWTCTPVTIEYVLDKFGEEACTYIDADIYFFGNPEVLFREIEGSGCDVVITEHRFGRNPIRRRWLKKSGKYCVEFNYFNNSANARKVLKWWKDKCFEWCFALYEADRMGDQKYLEKFPILFEGVHELQHPGGGVAPWNLYQYRLENMADGIVLRERRTGKTFPLIFYHFQNIRYLSDSKLNINSGSHDGKLKRSIYYPYLREISEVRAFLCREYSLDFKIKKSCSSNKVKAFLQNNIMQYKIKSLSDIVYLDRIIENSR